MNKTEKEWIKQKQIFIDPKGNWRCILISYMETEGTRWEMEAQEQFSYMEAKGIQRITMNWNQKDSKFCVVFSSSSVSSTNHSHFNQ